MALQHGLRSYLAQIYDSIIAHISSYKTIRFTNEFMPIISQNLLENLSMTYDMYVDQMIDDGHDNLTQYLQNFNGLPSNSEERQELIDGISNYSMAPLARFFPENNQSVALVAANPGLASTPEFYLQGEGALLNECNENIDQMATISKNYLPEYLNRDSNSWSDLINIVRKGIPDMRYNHESLSKYLYNDTCSHPYENLRDMNQVDHERGFFNDIYYTNAYKFATNGVSDIENWKFAVDNLLRELDIVDPKIVICASKLSWEMIFNGLSKEQISSVNDSPITTDWYKMRGNKEVDKARYAVYNTDNYLVVNIRHPARGINQSKTTDAIRLATQLLQSD